MDFLKYKCTSDSQRRFDRIIFSAGDPANVRVETPVQDLLASTILKVVSLVGGVFLERPNMGCIPQTLSNYPIQLSPQFKPSFLIPVITGSNLYGAVHTKGLFNANQFDLGEVSQRSPTSNGLFMLT